jgi:hypothetical protein
MDLALHFLHIYHLDFHLKNKILPSIFEKILWSNKFLKVEIIFYENQDGMWPWALNLDYTTFPFLHSGIL